MSVDLGVQYKKIIQFFWDPEPKNDDHPHLPIWCLGQEYRQPEAPSSLSSTQTLDPLSQPQETGAGTSTDRDRPPTPSSAISSFVKLPASTGPDHAWPAGFLDDFGSRIWITYRSGFPPIPKQPASSSNVPLGVRLRSQLIDSHGFTSDTGWGCMIRSGQSLLANTLLFLRLGRGWRRGDVQAESDLLSLFADHPAAPFSIHRFVQHGAQACGKCPGEWFGPSAAARCIQALAGECAEAGLRVYVTSDGADIYERQFRETCLDGEGGMRPTLLLLGVRLGIDRVTPVYWEALKDVLRYPQAVGIAGGRPSSSHYFIASQGDAFFYLDPHTTRPSLPARTDSGEVYSPAELETYHTRRLRRLDVREMDPSMLIGLLVRDEADWADLKARVRARGGRGAVIHVFEGEGGERAGAEEDVESFDDE